MNKQQYELPPVLVGTMRLGVWGAQMNGQQLENYIDACIDMGLNHFDLADIYGHYTTEQEFGAVLKRRSDLKQQIQITTKCGINLVCPNRPAIKVKSYDTSRQHIIWSVENSLTQLQVEQLNTLLIHRPDYLMNPHEIAETATQLLQSGKIAHFGVSNFTPSQFNLLNSLIPLATNQVEINLLHVNAFTDGTLDQCMLHNVQATAWSPLGGGQLFDSNSSSEQVMRIRKVALQLAAQYQVSIDIILYAWLYKHPCNIVPVVGTSKPKRLKAALAAKQLELSHQEWYMLWEASIGHEVA